MMLESDLSAPLLPIPATSEAPRSLFEYLQILLFGVARETGGVTADERKLEVDTKTYLANERTFLDWIYVAFIISTLGMSVGAWTGMAVIGSSALVLVWATVVYHQRVQNLSVVMHCSYRYAPNFR
jgi:hypothetical protein